MSLDVNAILNGVVSHAGQSALFETVNQHETTAAPGNGLHAAVWVDRISPVALASGLAVTSVRLALNVRIYGSALQYPRDDIDPNILSAVATLMVAYSGDFELGGNVRNIDLLGQFGEPLSARAGYVNLDDGLYRVMTIVLPVVVNDVFTQAA